MLPSPPRFRATLKLMTNHPVRIYNIAHQIVSAGEFYVVSEATMFSSVHMQDDLKLISHLTVRHHLYKLILKKTIDYYLYSSII